MSIDLELATSDELAAEIERIARSIFHIMPILNEINQRCGPGTMLGARSRHLATLIGSLDVESSQLVASLRGELAMDRSIDGERRDS